MTHCNKKFMRNHYNYFIEHLEKLPYRLEDCYTRYSAAKQNAYNYCMDLFMNKYNGYAHLTKFAILGYNTMQFSFAFIGEIDGKEAFFYITRDYDRYIFVDEMEA